MNRWMSAATAALASLLTFSMGACDGPSPKSSPMTTLPMETQVAEQPHLPEPPAEPAAPIEPTMLAPWAPAAVENRTVMVEGVERHYILSLPPGARQREKLPIIFAFHGKGEEAATMQRHTNLDAADAIVVYMQGVDKAWSPAPYAKTSPEQDLAYVDAVRHQLLGEFNVDRVKVFAAGFSNGGGFATFLSCRRPQDFTAVATVAAANYEQVSEGCSVIPMKQIDFHGTDDPVIKYAGGVRHGSAYASVAASTHDAAARNRCDAGPHATPLEHQVVEEQWIGCDAGLEHYRLEGGRHVWPGGEADRSELPRGFATQRMLAFFGVGTR